MAEIQTSSKEEPSFLFNFNDLEMKALEAGATIERSFKCSVPKAFRGGDTAAVTNGKDWAVSRSRLDRRGSGVWPEANDKHLSPPSGPVGNTVTACGTKKRFLVEVVDVSLEPVTDEGDRWFWFIKFRKSDV